MKLKFESGGNVRGGRTVLEPSSVGITLVLKPDFVVGIARINPRLPTAYPPKARRSTSTFPTVKDGYSDLIQRWISWES